MVLTPWWCVVELKDKARGELVDYGYGEVDCSCGRSFGRSVIDSLVEYGWTDQ